MPVDLKYNDFYVCILSNNSLHFYPENTLSAFTNALARPCKLDDSWSVGLTEIALPEREKNPDDHKVVKHQISDKAYKGTRKKVKRSYVETFTSVKLDEKTSLQWWSNGLKALSYKERHINFSVLLSSFFTAVDPSWGSVLISDVKKKILARIEEDYTHNAIPEINLKNVGADRYTLHVYQGSDISENVTLVRKNYDTIEGFFDDIIGQIPRERRNHTSLKYTVDHYIVSWDSGSKENGDTTEEGHALVLIVKDLGVRIKIKDPFPSRLGIEDLIALFLANVHFDDDSLTPRQRRKKSNEIYRKIYGVYKKLSKESLDVKPPYIRELTELSNILHIPYEKQASGGLLTTPVPIDMKLDDLANFITDIFLQTPVEKRNPELVMSELEKSFDNVKRLEGDIPTEDRITVPQTSPNQEDYTSLENRIIGLETPTDEMAEKFPREPYKSEAYFQKNSIINVYTDIIQPRIIGDKLVRYLRIIPMGECESVIRFQHVEYSPIEKTFFESISVKITDHQGNFIDFKTGYTPTYVMLHFKRQ